MSKRIVRKKGLAIEKLKGSGGGLPSSDELRAKVKQLTEEDSGGSPGKTGRPPLQERRVALTTSLTEQNKMDLSILAAKKGVRLADVLNEILSEYFKNNPL